MEKSKIVAGIILGSFILIIGASCKDYLDLSPISSYNAGSFYVTQSDFNLAVNGAYSELQSLYENNLFYTLEARSDNVDTDTEYDYGIVSKFTDNATTSELLTVWERFWILVDRCNAIIDQIDDGTFDDESYRSYYKGEAHFLRGYAYFQLGCLYGGMPLIDHQMKVSEIKTTARSTQGETFDFAASDLEQAAGLLPGSWSSSELGKATKYAAEGILARLCLFQGKYAEAKSLLTDIISSGKYEMASDYENCFLDSHDISSEHVFQIQFTSGGQGNAVPEASAPEQIKSELFPQSGKSSFLKVSDDLYDSYESGDLRRDISVQKGYLNNAGVVDLVTCFYIKYAHGTTSTTKYDRDVNLPILRYTDVKLMYAEVLNEEGYHAVGDAFSVLNEVRNRSGLSSLSSAEVPDQETFRYALMQERRSEFAFEALRWFDLVRTGKALSVINTFLSRADQESGKYKMHDYQKIFAIPQDELNNNPDTDYMWQNPEY